MRPPTVFGPAGTAVSQTGTNLRDRDLQRADGAVGSCLSGSESGTRIEDVFRKVSHSRHVPKNRTSVRWKKRSLLILQEVLRAVTGLNCSVTALTRCLDCGDFTSGGEGVSGVERTCTNCNQAESVRVSREARMASARDNPFQLGTSAPEHRDRTFFWSRVACT